MMNYAILNKDGSITKTDNATEAYKSDVVIKQEYFGVFWVSTVFLPLDHGHGGIPIHFETYVFPAKEGEVTSLSEIWGRRAKSKEEALEYHEEAKREIEAGTIAA